MGKSKEDLLLEAELAEIEVLKEREKELELLKKARLEKLKMKDNIERLSQPEHKTVTGKKKSLHDMVDRMNVDSREVNQTRRSSMYSGLDTIRKDDYTRRIVDRDMEEIVELPFL